MQTGHSFKLQTSALPQRNQKVVVSISKFCQRGIYLISQQRIIKSKASFAVYVVPLKFNQSAT